MNTWLPPFRRKEPPIDKLTFSFESPRAGWLPMRVAAGDARISLDVSSVPNDFVDELIATTERVMALEGTFTFVANEEPGETRITLARKGNVFTLAVQRIDDEHASFKFSGTAASVVLPIWRALRRLQADPQLAQWGHSFPTEPIARLSRSVEQLKRSMSDSPRSTSGKAVR